MIDQAVLEHFTVSRLAPDELDLRVDRIQKASPERQDLGGRDAGREADYHKSLAALREAEGALGLAPARLARLLTQALAIEGGTLPIGARPGVYRIEAPPSWKALIDDTLRIKKGDLEGGLPKVTFDAAALEVVEHGRRVFRPRPDTVLLRLGHPVMRRAQGVLRRRMWDDGGGRGLSRWTVRQGGLPDGVSLALIVYGLVTATNVLREIVHAEVLPLAFAAEGPDLRPMDPKPTQTLARTEGDSLSDAQLATLVPKLQSLWLNHMNPIEDALRALSRSQTSAMEVLLTASLKEETAREREKFVARKKELQAQRLPKAVEKLRKETEEMERRLVQSPMLFQEMQETEERRLRERQWEVHRTQQDQLLDYLKHEEARIIDEVLPKRFSLARLDVQPVAIEYRLAGGASR